MTLKNVLPVLVIVAGALPENVIVPAVAVNVPAPEKHAVPPAILKLDEVVTAPATARL